MCPENVLKPKKSKGVSPLWKPSQSETFSVYQSCTVSLMSEIVCSVFKMVLEVEWVGVSYTDYSCFGPFSGHMSLTRMSMSSRATTISRKLSSRFSPRLLVRSILMGCSGSAVVPCSPSDLAPGGRSSCLPVNTGYIAPLVSHMP